jgi:hypothetical protein
MRCRSGRSSSNFKVEFVGLLPGAACAMTEVFIRDAIDKMIINAGLDIEVVRKPSILVLTNITRTTTTREPLMPKKTASLIS